MLYTPLNDMQNNCAAKNCARLLDAHLQDWQPKKIDIKYFKKFKDMLSDFFETVEYLNPDEAGDAYSITLIDQYLAHISTRLGFGEYCSPSYHDLTTQHIGKPSKYRPDI